MEILILVFMTTVSAIVMKDFDTSRPNHARPGAIIRRIPQASSLAMLENNNDILSLIPAATVDPASPSASAIVIETESQALTMTDTPTSICTPVSTCVDKFSICPDRSRKRYGGCYDKNFCDGNTSPYPIPTCS
ncbi:unnamed protein product [Cercospora beticola]|nr:unnamed protein product [Cercospora beticola]